MILYFTQPSNNLIPVTIINIQTTDPKHHQPTLILHTDILILNHDQQLL